MYISKSVFRYYTTYEMLIPFIHNFLLLMYMMHSDILENQCDTAENVFGSVKLGYTTISAYF